MNLEDVSIKQLREVFDFFNKAGGDKHPYTIGSKVLIRTVTFYFTGKITAVYPSEIVLTDAAWIADTGKFEKALSTGSLENVEPIPQDPCIVGRNAIIDCNVWKHELPREVK